MAPYDATSTLSESKLAADAASLPGIRLVDPQVVSDAFEQLQQVRGYYSVPSVLDVDRYQIDGRERDMVLAARELDLNGLPDGQRNWANEHTVYTHGYGVIAAYGNQQDAQDKPVTNNKGQPVWAEEDLPPVGELTDHEQRAATSRRSTSARSSPDYSIVGRSRRREAVELDVPQGASDVSSTNNNVYQGKAGVPIGGRVQQAALRDEVRRRQHLAVLPGQRELADPLRPQPAANAWRRSRRG